MLKQIAAQEATQTISDTLHTRIAIQKKENKNVKSSLCQPLDAHRAVKGRESHIDQSIGLQPAVRSPASIPAAPTPRVSSGTHSCQRPSTPRGHEVVRGTKSRRIIQRPRRDSNSCTSGSQESVSIICATTNTNQLTNSVELSTTREAGHKLYGHSVDSQHFYGTRRFITAFTRALYLLPILGQTKSVHNTQPYL
jgi:hypothetical protein